MYRDLCRFVVEPTGVEPAEPIFSGVGLNHSGPTAGVFQTKITKFEQILRNEPHPTRPGIKHFLPGYELL
jgi:hypothetical protein